MEIHKQGKTGKSWGFTSARISGNSPEFYVPPSGTCMTARRQVKVNGGCSELAARGISVSGQLVRSFRQAIIAWVVGVKALGGTCPPPGGLEACCAQRLVSSAKQYCCSRIGFACFDVRVYKIGVKHVAFLELWLRMTSLELWLGMADEHDELLSCGSSWRVLPVRLPPQY
ncbi:hypothetical protein DEO72_LG2g3802 [Vigna unguiculata]|uniref:Uncharacterized protein n=1 Tax=Vigna unguiculata TaxID=3917 RepID=A0A4D6L4Q1_VIGUN|nr:hypothetical protein DEO72_LG2g3802 [Vigna unguiculata]